VRLVDFTIFGDAAVANVCVGQTNRKLRMIVVVVVPERVQTAHVRAFFAERWAAQERPKQGLGAIASGGVPARQHGVRADESRELVVGNAPFVGRGHDLVHVEDAFDAHRFGVVAQAIGPVPAIETHELFGVEPVFDDVCPGLVQTALQFTAVGEAPNRVHPKTTAGFAVDNRRRVPARAPEVGAHAFVDRVLERVSFARAPARCVTGYRQSWIPSAAIFGCRHGWSAVIAPRKFTVRDPVGTGRQHGGGPACGIRRIEELLVASTAQQYAGAQQ
jgi:hypothetical protein